MQLETERLVLRRLRMDDLDVMAELYADADVMRYIGPGEPIDRDRSRLSLERMVGSLEADGFGQLAVERKEDGAMMGRCGLLVWDPTSWTPTRASEATGPVEIEVGYLLGSEYWGRGYATEAAIAVRDWALAKLAPERLIALIQPGNDRSVGVARKLGMAPDGEAEIFGKRVIVYALGNRPAR